VGLFAKAYQSEFISISMTMRLTISINIPSQDAKAINKDILYLA
jgi:hypothetical protein